MTDTSLDLITLFAIACGLLVLATLIGEILRARLSQDRSHPTVETYLTRVHSWWAMTVLTSLALLAGKTAVMLLFAFISFAALREFLTLTTKTKADHWAMIASFYFILPVQFVLIGMGESGLFSIFIPVYAFLLLPILSVLRGASGKFLARISETQWGLMICVYCASHIPALITLDLAGAENRSVLLIAFIVVVVQLGDLGDYFVGRRFGKRRVAPDVSPRTWEGCGAGIIVAALTGLALAWITPFSPIAAIGMAAISFLVGVGGSLVLKAIKKDLGVKDWGHLIPGQGGFVDQLDSVIFAAPIFYHLTRLFWT
jgi:phosphatidate cytidylyltransferase